MKNLSKLEDHDRFYNWYHGYTKFVDAYPWYYKGQLFFKVLTSATSGNISTQSFGGKFDTRKVEPFIYIRIKVYVPKSVREVKKTSEGRIIENNITLIYNIEKKTILEFSDKDKIGTEMEGWIDADKNNYRKNFTYEIFDGPIKEYYNMMHDRKISSKDIREGLIQNKQDLKIVIPTLHGVGALTFKIFPNFPHFFSIFLTP